MVYLTFKSSIMISGGLIGLRAPIGSGGLGGLELHAHRPHNNNVILIMFFMLLSRLNGALADILCQIKRTTTQLTTVSKHSPSAFTG